MEQALTLIVVRTTENGGEGLAAGLISLPAWPGWWAGGRRRGKQKGRVVWVIKGLENCQLDLNNHPVEMRVKVLRE